MCIIPNQIILHSSSRYPNIHSAQSNARDRPRNTRYIIPVLFKGILALKCRVEIGGICRLGDVNPSNPPQLEVGSEANTTCSLHHCEHSQAYCVSGHLLPHGQHFNISSRGQTSLELDLVVQEQLKNGPAETGVCFENCKKGCVGVDS